MKLNLKLNSLRYMLEKNSTHCWVIMAIIKLVPLVLQLPIRYTRSVM